MAYEYVNIRTDTIDNVKVPTKETLDARTIIESTLEPAAGADDKLYVYNIGLWQFPKTGFYKIKLAKVGALGVLLKLYARITKDDGTTPDDWDNDNLKAMGNAGGDGLIEEIYAQVDYINDDKFTAYRVQFFNCFGYLGSFWVNTYDKTTQKWAYDYKHRVTADHVSNMLTLTKGDTTTVYNGSVAREVSIPTKTSELTNDSFVSYAEQTLTEGQQNQAKTNLGIDVLTGNTTAITPTQVKEAILNGRPVVITYTDTTYGNLTFTSFGYSLENNVVVANLVATYNSQYILADLTGMSSNDQWDLQTTKLGTSTDIANNYVKYSESQTLTDEQKVTARTNIGAVSSDELVQSDWNQNDTIAKDYIKNRICYEEETVTELGNTYAVWNELTTADRYTPISYKMNGTIYKDVVPIYSSTAGVYMYNGVAPYDHYISVSTQNSSIDSGGVNFQFVKVENTVKQIDPKFIPTVSPDWNQNNETAKDYIKNRICYTKDATETIVLNSTLPFTDSSSGLTVFSYQDTSSNIKFNEGTTYTVNFDTTSYTCIAFTDDRLSNAVILGNLGIGGMSSATNEPFAIITDNKGDNGLQIVTNLTGTSHNVKIAESHTEIVKLDKKYIPDDIFINIENIDNKVEDFINNAQFLAKTDSVGTGSFSFNRETGSTVGENSATFGLNNIASGKYAFAEGSTNKATNFASHAEGNSTTASGNVSHAEGSSTKATGATSHSEGLDTVASGDYSHAEGEGTTAEGKWSHTEGKSTNTKGWASHAEGSETVAQGICSHAEGRFTVALGENQHVEGILNIEDTTSLHIVGNGTYTESSGQKTKSNAHTLDKLGNAWFAGNVYVGSTSGTNKDDGSKKLATEEYVNNKTTTITVEDTLSDTSTNPVQNKVINTALKDKLQYKGNWQSNTTYNKNDVVYDETNLMYVYTETDATSDPPDINPNCQPLVNIATNVKKGTLGVPNASTIYSQFNYLIDASTTDSGKYLTVNSEGNPEWGTITAPEESVVIAKLTGAGTTASPYACDKTYNELYTAILAGKYVLMYDNTTKRMLSPYFINIQARLLQFQHVLYEQTGSTTTTSKLTAITVNYNGGSNTLTRTVYSSNIVSSVNGKTENVITLSASDVGAASSEDLNTLKNSIPEISVVTLDD